MFRWFTARFTDMVSFREQFFCQLNSILGNIPSRKARNDEADGGLLNMEYLLFSFRPYHKH